MLIFFSYTHTLQGLELRVCGLGLGLALGPRGLGLESCRLGLGSSPVDLDSDSKPQNSDSDLVDLITSVQMALAVNSQHEMH